MYPYGLDISKIVKYVCICAVSIVGIIFGCFAVVKLKEIECEHLCGWDDEE